MIYKADVCIVGAGPGGALLAYLLAKKNVSVILLERHAAMAREFRGEHLNEEGEAILKKHGLFSAVEELGLLRMEQIEYWNDGKLERKVLPDSESWAFRDSCTSSPFIDRFIKRSGGL